MTHCKLDHSLDDVVTKLTTQKAFLPNSLFKELHSYLGPEVEQAELNEVFHLLKKYDLSSDEIKRKREASLYKLISKP